MSILSRDFQPYIQTSVWHKHLFFFHIKRQRFFSTFQRLSRNFSPSFFPIGKTFFSIFLKNSYMIELLGVAQYIMYIDVQDGALFFGNWNPYIFLNDTFHLKSIERFSVCAFFFWEQKYAVSFFLERKKQKKKNLPQKNTVQISSFLKQMSYYYFFPKKKQVHYTLELFCNFWQKNVITGHLNGQKYYHIVDFKKWLLYHVIWMKISLGVQNIFKKFLVLFGTFYTSFLKPFRKPLGKFFVLKSPFEIL